jgi:hypothetical protein
LINVEFKGQPLAAPKDDDKWLAFVPPGHSMGNSRTVDRTLFGKSWLERIKTYRFVICPTEKNILNILE